MDKKSTCLTFAVEPVADASGAAPTRFRGVAYSGGIIPKYGSYGDSAIDLATLGLPEGALFALVDHDPAQRAGKVSAFLSGDAVLVEGELFTSTQAGREVAALMAEGAPWQLSVGIQADVDYSPRPRDWAGNGQTFSVNTVFHRAALREVSFVPVGADPNTTVAAFARNLAAAPSLITASGESDMTLEDLQAQVEKLQAQASELMKKLGDETAAKEKAEDEKEKVAAELAAIKAAAREKALTELAADLGRDLTPEETQVMTALDEPAFATLRGTLLSFRPQQSAPAFLFTEQATGGKAPEPDATLADLHAQLRAQLVTR